MFDALTLEKNLQKFKNKIINHNRFNKHTHRHKNIRQRKKSAIILHKNKMIHDKIVFPNYNESKVKDGDFKNKFSKKFILSTNMIKKKMNALRAKLSDGNISKELMKNSSSSDISVKSAQSLSNFSKQSFFTKAKLNKQVDTLLNRLDRSLSYLIYFVLFVC